MTEFSNLFSWIFRYFNTIITNQNINVTYHLRYVSKTVLWTHIFIIKSNRFYPPAIVFYFKNSKLLFNLCTCKCVLLQNSKLLFYFLNFFWYLDIEFKMGWVTYCKHSQPHLSHIILHDITVWDGLCTVKSVQVDCKTMNNIL